MVIMIILVFAIYKVMEVDASDPPAVSGTNRLLLQFEETTVAQAIVLLD